MKPSAMRNVVASYMRDGHSEKDAVREAQKWQERMELAKRQIEKRSAEPVQRVSPLA